MNRIVFYSPATVPPDESRRQRSVDRSGLLAGASVDALRHIVSRAAESFRAPIAAISIVDRERQWFAAAIGLNTDETPRAISFCAHAILRPGEALVVPDATRDRRFAGNPLVLSAPHIRFYVGIPLVDRHGLPLGTLCIIDSKPRADAPDLVALGLLAHEAEQLFAP